MIIQRSQNRALIIRSLLGWVPDIVISYAIAVASSSTYDNGFNQFMGAVFVFVGLQVFYLLIWLKNSLWNWLIFKVSDRDKMVRHLEDYLDHNDFPSPGEYVYSAENYLQDVVLDEGANVNLRIKAASEIGGLNMLRSNGYAQHLLKISIAFDEALKNYARTCRSREKRTGIDED